MANSAMSIICVDKSVKTGSVVGQTFCVAATDAKLPCCIQDSGGQIAILLMRPGRVMQAIDPI